MYSLVLVLIKDVLDAIMKAGFIYGKIIGVAEYFIFNFLILTEIFLLFVIFAILESK